MKSIIFFVIFIVLSGIVTTEGPTKEFQNSEHESHYFEEHETQNGPPTRPTSPEPGMKDDDNDNGNSSSSNDDNNSNSCCSNEASTKKPVPTKQPESTVPPTTVRTITTANTQPTTWVIQTETTWENPTLPSTWNNPITNAATISSLPETTVESTTRNTSETAHHTNWGSIIRTETIATPKFSSNTFSPLIQKCIDLCPQRTMLKFNLLCGTNDTMYQNIELLLCVQNCGIDIELLCRQVSCTSSSCNFPETTTKAAAASTTSSSYAMQTKSNLYQCLTACHITSEYNPVCGTNGITYGNPGKLLCAQLCGIDVKVKQFSVCSSGENPNTTPSTTTTTTGTTPYTTTLSPFTISCIRGCRVTPVYDPVCGTNNVTYANLGKLECAKICGVKVELRIKSACMTDENGFEVEDAGKVTSTTKTPAKDNQDVTKPLDQTFTAGFNSEKDLLDIIFGKTSTTTTTTDLNVTYDLDVRFNSNSSSNNNLTGF